MYRLLIADDESIECRALEHKIKYISDRLEILPSVYDGVSLMKSIEKYKPHIIIVDINMPGLNGLEVIELLRMKNISVKIIMNTAYSDFSFIQKALKLGVNDYLLKPHNNEELTDAVLKVIQELDCEHRQRHEQAKNKAAADTLWNVAAEKWILSLIIEEPDENCYQLLQNSFPQINNGGGFLKWRVARSAQASYIETKTIAREILSHLQKLCSCISAEYKDSFFTFIMASTSEQYEVFIQETARHICNEFQKKGIFLTVGIGRYKKTPDQFAAGLQESRVALLSKEGSGIFLFNYAASQIPASSLRVLAKKSADLLNKGMVEECIRLMKDIIAKDYSSFDNLNLLEVHVIDYMISLEEHLQKITEKNFIETWIPWNSLSSTDSTEQITGYLENWIQECYRSYCIQNSVSNLYVEKALLFIQENYSRDISLETTAESIGISPFYLSRLLKQQKKQTFLEILTETRIRKSIQLMQNNQLSMKEICQKTGYSNVTYFYKAFKKSTGLTVGTVKKYLLN